MQHYKVVRNVSTAYGDITYEITYKEMKNLRLRIKENGLVSVSAPLGLKESYIDKFVVSKAEFVFNVIEKTREHQDIFLVGEIPEKVFFLGDCYDVEHISVLHLVEEDVKVENGKILVYSREEMGSAHTLRLLQSWYREKAYSFIRQYAKRAYKEFYKEIHGFPEIRIRVMTSKWGSCQVKKEVLTFNTRLVQLDEECIEYVVWHEFTHFVHPNHSSDFYHRLEQYMPQYKMVQKRMKLW